MISDGKKHSVPPCHTPGQASQPKLETEPANIADKDSWVSKPNMTADLEKVACQKATFTKEFK